MIGIAFGTCAQILPMGSVKRIKERVSNEVRNVEKLRGFGL